MNTNTLLDIDFIKRNDIFSRSFINSGMVSQYIFSQKENLSTNFNYTMIINNHSNIFLKDITFDTEISDYTENENVINILNTNQGKVFGNNITIKNGYRYNDFFFTEDTNLSTKLNNGSISTYNWNNTLTTIPPYTSTTINEEQIEVTASAAINALPLNNIATVNLENSQTTLQCDQLSDINLQNGRNQNQSFFNLPNPSDVSNFHVIPMLISNGQRMMWSEGKYGYIVEDQIKTIDDFLKYVPHDLNGQQFKFVVTPDMIDNLNRLSSYFNGSLTMVHRRELINGEEQIITFDNFTIQNCNIKITLSGFNFKKLTIKNSYKIYLTDCTFIRTLSQENRQTLIPEINTTYNILQWKKSNTNWVSAICLDIDSSKVFIQNNNTNLYFKKFYIGIKANHNSEVFINTFSDTKSIIIDQNLTDYTPSSNRPVLFLACNGSRIYCNYKKYKMRIKYPPKNKNLCYIPSSNKDFEVSDIIQYNDIDNYKRAKSLLVALYEEMNSARVYCKFNKMNEETQFENLDTAIPSYGIFQVAKPYRGLYDNWLGNKNLHILSGTKKTGEEDRIIYDEYGNTLDNKFVDYGLTLQIDSVYTSKQPHLAHYFLYPDNMVNKVQMVVQNKKLDSAPLVYKTYQQQEK